MRIAYIATKKGNETDKGRMATCPHPHLQRALHCSLVTKKSSTGGFSLRNVPARVAKKLRTTEKKISNLGQLSFLVRIILVALTTSLVAVFAPQ